MDVINLYYQKGRYDKESELNPPVSLNHTRQEPNYDTIKHRNWEYHMAFCNFVLNVIHPPDLQIGTDITTEVFVGELYFLSLFE